MIDRRLIQNFDWQLFFLIILVAGLGLVVLYSAVASGSAVHRGVLNRQLFWLGLGFVAMAAALVLDYKWLERLAYPAYGVGVVLLILVLLSGKTASGARRWLDLGVVAFQPSELMKPILVIMLGRYFSKHQKPAGLTLRDLVVPAALVGLPVVLIALQPDLGTALLLSAVAGSMILFVGMRPTSLLLLAGGGIGSMPILWLAMKGYQRRRILTLIDPSRDPLGAGYHIIQSKIAVGSGHLWGKGFLHGTQSQLRFIPEHHTDFIFSVLAEEWGFVGSVVFLALFLLLLLRGVEIASRSRDYFGALVALGITAIMFWQITVNIGMVLGMLPVVGIPLPLVSYGGSSMVVTMGGLGILLNVSMRKFLFH